MIGLGCVAKWLHLATWCQVRSILSTRTGNCNTCQDDPFPDLDYMDYPGHITFWPLTLKVTNGLTPNLPVCSSAQSTPCKLRILRSIDKSKFYGLSSE